MIQNVTSTEYISKLIPSTASDCIAQQSVFPISLKMLLSPPQEVFRIEKTADKIRGKTVILTSSPYKLELKTDIKEKEAKHPAKRKRKLLKKKFKINRKITQKRLSRNPQKMKKRMKPACNELYSNFKSKEGRIQCFKCHGCAHEACSNAEEYDDKFICDFCS